MSFIENLINQDIDVSINGIANSEVSAIRILDRKSLDIISDNLQGCVYPIVSKIYSKSIQNVKNSILKATDHMYYDCDINRLKTYFGLIKIFAQA